MWLNLFNALNHYVQKLGATCFKLKLFGIAKYFLLSFR
jgi:hypothetical protein